ncbi:MAG TPA: Wzz/FepE/Etk N-terminal domain-containing protein, partial [Flavitalea sp.]|nr:Wzz/FepE/Etk N-terminal domain-containing protein [Flavitalea sp.]
MEHSFIDEKEAGGGFDIKTYFSKLGKNFFWFILTLVIFGVGAMLYLKYTLPLYKLSTYVLIKKPTEAKNLIGGTPFANGSSDNNSGMVDINSEIFKLKSGTILGEAIDSLHLQISLSSNESVKHQPVSLDSVFFAVKAKMADPNRESPLYTLVLHDDSYKLTSELSGITGIYGQPVKVGTDTITIQKKPGFKAGTEYDLQLLGRDNVINKYIERIE